MIDDPADIGLDPAIDVVNETAAAPATEAQNLNAGQVLAMFIQMPNIAAVMDDGEGQSRLAAISSEVMDGYEIDIRSREKWIEKNHDAMKLAMMVAEAKDYPFQGAANVKYPLIATAALQFNARSYPAIVPGDRVVQGKVRGRDPQGIKAARGERVSEFMSDQLLNQMPEWESDTDKLLIILPIEGSVFRKVWYDPALKRNVSRLVLADNFVVNYWSRSLEDTPRKTEKLWLYPYEIAERILDGRFVTFDYANGGNDTEDTEKDKPGFAEGNDTSAPQLFLEQHRLLDLDEDGYPEPYIVTVHKYSGKVVRIVANFGPDEVRLTNDGRVAAIRPRSYFVHYQFLPNPDGGFYGLGLGWLLSATNETINSTLNMMMDAGHLASIQGGLISSVLGLREKSIKLKMGEWRVVNTAGPLSQAVMPIKYDGPSDVLFKLLGLMIEGGKELASIKDVLTGEGQGKNASPTTVMALIEQGLQVFTSIYKRVHRTLKFEFMLIADLNGANVSQEEYAAFLDDPQADPKADFNAKDMDILPVSDPQSVTKMQKLAKAQLLMEVGGEDPLFNPFEVRKRFLEAAGIEDIETLIAEPPPPDPEQAAMAKRGMDAEIEKIESEAAKNFATALKSIADAEAVEPGQQLAFYDRVLKIIQAEHSMEQDLNDPARQGGVPGMEGAPADAMGLPAPETANPGAGAGPAGPAPELGGPAPGGMVPAAAPSGLPEGAL